MKKKILLSLVACFIAAGSLIGYNYSENNHNMDISLADISVMAQADGESGGPTDCYHEYDRGGNETRVICELWVNGIYERCKNVTDLSLWDYLGTFLSICNPIKY